VVLHVGQLQSKIPPESAIENYPIHVDDQYLGNAACRQIFPALTDCRPDDQECPAITGDDDRLSVLSDGHSFAPFRIGLEL
jgi:hypothetical protein